jgi:hypothetical protein
MSYIFADYGTNIVPAANLALQRGSGNFNPAPTYDQTVNRGPANSQALNYYSTYALQMDPNLTATDNSGVIYRSDVENKRPYVVGTSFMHPESTGSWTQSDYENSRGSDRYQAWAVNSLHITPNALLNFFFSADNVNYLQKRITSDIKEISGHDIKEQSIDELLIIMRNKYIYALEGYLPGPGYTAAGDKPMPRGPIKGPVGTGLYPEGSGSLEDQLSRLNKSVLEECIKSVLSGIQAYLQYYKDASSLPLPLSHPVFTSYKGANVLQENLGFESGHEMSTAISSYNQRFNII